MNFQKLSGLESIRIGHQDDGVAVFPQACRWQDNGGSLMENLACELRLNLMMSGNKYPEIVIVDTDETTFLEKWCWT